jgi:hypothetical protein
MISAYLLECVLKQALYIDASNENDLCIYTNVLYLPVDPHGLRKVTVQDLYNGKTEYVEDTIRLAISYMYGM